MTCDRRSAAIGGGRRLVGAVLERVRDSDHRKPNGNTQQSEAQSGLVGLNDRSADALEQHEGGSQERDQLPVRRPGAS